MATLSTQPRRPSGVSPLTNGGVVTSFGTSANNRTPLALKCSRILSGNFEENGTRVALDTLCSIMKLSEIKKSNLRKEVGIRVNKTTNKFLFEFNKVNLKLSDLQQDLDLIHHDCDQIQESLESANTATRYLLQHAQGLREQRATTTTQQSLVHLFLDRFTLSDEELLALTSREIPVGKELFAAMDKTDRIRADCRALLSGEAGDGTQAGLDIMEYTSQHLEAGYSKLFKWCSFECRGFSKDALEVSSTMRYAIQRLYSRPDLLNEILSLLGSTRSASILSLFLEALTRGGPSGLPRPIELHAHDPIRYIGDMLAWIHQTMAGEREFLESFFGMKADGRWVGSVRRQSKGDDETRLRTLLDKDLEGCGRPLKIRVQQTIKSQESSIMAYRIASLIHFYKITMERTIGKEALMSAVLTEMMNDAYESFHSTLEAQGRSLVRFIQPPAAALSPPTMLLETLSTLREIMHVYNDSRLDSMDSEQEALKRQADFTRVLKESLDPAVLMCEKMGEFRSTEWEKNLFKINCLDCIGLVLEGFDFTKEKQLELEEAKSIAVNGLIEEHFLNLLTECGLDPILAALETKDEATPLSHLPASSSLVLSTAIQKFSNFLATTDTLTSPRLSLIPSKLAILIHGSSLAMISSSHAQVWDAVMDEKNRFEGRSTILRRSKEEVELLLVV